MIRGASGILALSLMCVSPAMAHGPIAIINGEPVVWSNFPVTYNVDLGTLGIFTNERATELTDNSFAAWNDVSTSSFAAVNGGHLSVDVTEMNYDQFIGSISTFTDGINPVVFDTDGRIIDLMFGGGASSTVLGYAQPAFNPIERAFIEAEVVINGVPTTRFSPLEIMSTIVHELGHLAGLDHTQINGNLAFTGNRNDTAFIPTMYPTSTQNDEPLAELNPDDMAGLTLLYPNERASAEFGTLKGAVNRTTGEPVLGANVLARMVDNELMNAFSSVSDYRMQNTGEWEMLVFPGTYRLSIEPINSRFVEGSSVGPYADSANDLSFLNPVAPQECSQTFTVAAGETLDGVNIVAGGECSRNSQGDGVVTETDPCIVMATDRVSYLEGQTVTVSFRIIAGTRNNVVDWYWLGLAPDGLIYNMADFLPQSENFTPYRENYTATSHQEQKSFLLSGIPEGLYTWGVVFTPPGADVLDSSTWTCEPSTTSFIFILGQGQ
ncbi:MAG: hypothetical protein JRI22_03380 [Deltaproteobacteria bacterium]|nr:hypothetical protein [Deltaproteobacteria bacterium]